MGKIRNVMIRWDGGVTLTVFPVIIKGSAKVTYSSDHAPVHILSLHGFLSLINFKTSTPPTIAFIFLCTFTLTTFVIP